MKVWVVIKYCPLPLYLSSLLLTTNITTSSLFMVRSQVTSIIGAHCHQLRYNYGWLSPLSLSFSHFRKCNFTISFIEQLSLTTNDEIAYFIKSKSDKRHDHLLWRYHGLMIVVRWVEKRKISIQVWPSATDVFPGKAGGFIKRKVWIYQDELTACLKVQLIS